MSCAPDRRHNPYHGVPLPYGAGHAEDALPTWPSALAAALAALAAARAAGVDPGGAAARGVLGPAARAAALLGLPPGTAALAALALLWWLAPRLRARLAARARRAGLAALARKARARRDDRRARLRPGLLMDDPAAEAAVCARTAAALLAAMRGGELTCEQVVRAFCSRALRTTAVTNNVTSEAYDEAMDAARAVDARRARPGHDVSAEPPLLGLPFSVKDHMDLRGFDSTAGAAVKTFCPAAKDSALVALLRRAGAIPFVKTNVPQSLMINESVNNVFGRSLNPWNLARTVGGSSGGEGGLIGADASPCGIGSDIGGSIRTPCLYNGICGLKTSPGRLTKVGNSGARWRGRNGQEAVKSVVGPMGREVNDLVLLMRAWLVPAQRDEFDFDLREVAPRFDEAEYASTRALRIGVVENDEFFPACASSRRAVREAADALRAQGHDVVVLRTANSEGAARPYGTRLSPETNPDGGGRGEDGPALPGIGDIFGLYARLIQADGGMQAMRGGIEGEALMPEYQFQYRMSTLIPDWLRPAVARVLRGVAGERFTRLGVLTPRSTTSGWQYWESIADRVKYRARFDAVWRAHELDALVTVGMPYPAHKHSMFSKVIAGNAWMFWANCLEYVSGVVPVSVVTAEEEGYGYDAGRHKGDPWAKAAAETMKGSAGLPVGVQILAPPGKEELVLRVMGEVERAVRFREQHAPQGILGGEGGCLTARL